MNLKEQWVRISNQPSLGEPFIAIDRDTRDMPPGLLELPPAVRMEAAPYPDLDGDDILRAAVFDLKRQVDAMAESIAGLRSTIEKQGRMIADLEGLWIIRAWRWIKNVAIK